MRGDEFTITNKPIKRHYNVENNVIKDSFDFSYSNQIQEHLSIVNMDPWFYIYDKYIQNQSREKLNKTKKTEFQ